MNEYICLGVGEHWIRCGQQFGSNYVALKTEKDKLPIICELSEATCVVCGKIAFSEKDCLPRDY